MLERRPLRICVICLHKTRSLQDNREGKKEERGDRRLGVGELKQVGEFRRSGYRRWDGEGTAVGFTEHMHAHTQLDKAGACQLQNIDQLLPLNLNYTKYYKRVLKAIINIIIVY